MWPRCSGGSGSRPGSSSTTWPPGRMPSTSDGLWSPGAVDRFEGVRDALGRSDPGRYDCRVKGVVMAGGQGTRLRPLTSNQPKPMLPIVGRPMMEHVLRLLREHGTTDVVATVQFLGSVIRTYFGDGSDLGISLAYATENEPLGTAGSVKNAEPFLDDTFLVISGDHVTDLDLSAAAEFHRQREAAATVIRRHVDDPLEFGIVITDDDGRIDR